MSIFLLHKRGETGFETSEHSHSLVLASVFDDSL